MAEWLLKNGLALDCVVFLDENDNKKVLQRGSRKPVNYSECGIPLDRRFCFYDQVHTTGMDIKHAPNARALLTLGKDMVLRDLSQGAYRMRGIDSGQKVTILLPDQIAHLIRHGLYPRLKEKDLELALARSGEAESMSPPSRSTSQLPVLANAGGITFPDDSLTAVEQMYCTARDPETKVLQEVVSWLVLNSIRAENMQYSVLQMQDCDSNFKIACLERILDPAIGYTTGSDSPALDVCCSSFMEDVKIDPASTIDKPNGPSSYAQLIQARWSRMCALLDQINRLDELLLKQHGKQGVAPVDPGFLKCLDLPPDDLTGEQQHERAIGTEQEQEQVLHKRKKKQTTTIIKPIFVFFLHIKQKHQRQTAPRS